MRLLLDGSGPPESVAPPPPPVQQATRTALSQYRAGNAGDQAGLQSELWNEAISTAKGKTAAAAEQSLLDDPSAYEAERAALHQEYDAYLPPGMTPGQLDQAFASAAASARGKLDQAATGAALKQYGQAKTAQPAAPDARATAGAQNAGFTQVVDAYMAQHGAYFVPGTAGYTAEEQTLLADPKGLAAAESQFTALPAGSTLPPGVQPADLASLAQGGELNAAATLLPQQTSQALKTYAQAASHAPGAPDLATATTALQTAGFNEEVLRYEQTHGGLYAAPGSARWQSDAQSLLKDPAALQTARDAVAAGHASELAAGGTDLQHFGADLWAGESVAKARLVQQQDTAPPTVCYASGQGPTPLDQQKQGEQDAVKSLSTALDGLPASGIDPTLGRQALMANGYVPALAGQIHQTMQTVSGTKGQTQADGIGFLYQTVHGTGGSSVDPALATQIVTAAAPTLQAYLANQSGASNDQASQAYVSTAGIYGVLQDAQQAGVPGAADLVRQIGQWSYAAANATDSSFSAGRGGRSKSKLDGLLPEVLTKAQQQQVSPNLLHQWAAMSRGKGAPAVGLHDNAWAWDQYGSSLDGNKPLAAIPLPAKTSLDVPATALTADQVHAGYDQALGLTTGAQQNGSLPPGVDPSAAAAAQVMMAGGYTASDDPALARAMIAGRQQQLDAAWQQQNAGKPAVMPVDALTRQAASEVGALGIVSPAAVQQGLQGMEASQPKPAPAAVSAATNTAYGALQKAKASGNPAAIAAAQQALNQAMASELLSIYGTRFPGSSLITDNENADWLYLAEGQVMGDHADDTAMLKQLPGLLMAGEITQASLAGTDQQSVIALDQSLAPLQQPGADPGNVALQAVLGDARVQQLIDRQVGAATTGTDAAKPTAALAHEAQVLAPLEQGDATGPVAQQIVQGTIASPVTQQILANAKAAAAPGPAPARTPAHTPAHTVTTFQAPGLTQTSGLATPQVGPGAVAGPLAPPPPANVALSTAAPLMQAAQLSPSLTLAVYHAFNLAGPVAAGATPANQLVAAAGDLRSAADYRNAAVIYAALPDNMQVDGSAAGVGQAQAAKIALLTAVGGQLSRPNGVAALNIQDWIQASFSGGDAAPAWLAQDLANGYQYQQGGKVATVGALSDASLVSTINTALYQPQGAGGAPGTGGPTADMTAAAGADGTTLQQFGSDDALARYVVQAYGLRPAADGTAYDPATIVYGHTTLGQVIAAIKQQAGVPTLDGGASIVLQATPVMIDGQLAASFRVQQADGSTAWVGPDAAVTQDWAGQNAALTRNLSGTVVQVVGGVAEADATGTANPLLKIDTPPPPPPVHHSIWESVAEDALAVTAGIAGTVLSGGNVLVGFGAAFAVQQIFDTVSDDGKETILKFGSDLVQGKASWKETEQFAVDTGTEAISSLGDGLGPIAAKWGAEKLGGFLVSKLVSGTAASAATETAVSAATETATSATTGTATAAAGTTATTAATTTATTAATTTATTATTATSGAVATGSATTAASGTASATEEATTETVTEAATVVAAGTATTLVAGSTTTAAAGTATTVASGTTATAATAASGTATTVASGTATTAGTATAETTETAATTAAGETSPGIEATAKPGAPPTTVQKLVQTAAGAATIQSVQAATALTNTTLTDWSQGTLSWNAIEQAAAQQGLNLAFSIPTGGLSGLVPTGQLFSQAVIGFGSGLAQSEIDDQLFEHHNLTRDDVLTSLIMTVPTTLQDIVSNHDGQQTIRDTVQGLPAAFKGTKPETETVAPTTSSKPDSEEPTALPSSEPVVETAAFTTPAKQGPDQSATLPAGKPVTETAATTVLPESGLNRPAAAETNLSGASPLAQIAFTALEGSSFMWDDATWNAVNDYVDEASGSSDPALQAAAQHAREALGSDSQSRGFMVSASESEALGALVAQDIRVHSAAGAQEQSAAPSLLKRALVVLAHPDDETLSAGAFRRFLQNGFKIDVVYLTESNGGSIFGLSDKGIPEVKYDASGKEESDPAAYAERRVHEMEAFWGGLGGDASNLDITVLNNPDFNPFKVAKNNVDYGIKADWDAETNRQVVVGKLNEQDYDFVFTTGKDPRIHEAHDKAHRVVDDAVAAYTAASGKAAPPIVEGVEEGWYALHELVPLDATPTIELNLDPGEFDQRQNTLRAHYSSQPPGHSNFFGNARTREVMRVPDMPQWKAAALQEILTAPPASAEATATSADGSAPVPTEPAPVTRMQVPKSDPTVIETVPAASRSTRPALVGPQTTEDLQALTTRYQQLATSGAGERPVPMTQAEEAQWFYLTQAGAPYVPEHTSLQDRLNLKGDDGSFWHGPRRDAVAYVSSDQPLHQVIGPSGAGLDLTGNTRPWASITGARAEATQLYNDQFANPDAGDQAIEWPPLVYKLIGPPEVLAAAVGSGHIDPELIEGGTAVVNPQGGLSHYTAMNADAKYSPQPGDVLTAPVKKGMTPRQVRRGVFKAARNLTGTAAGVYVGARWGLEGGQYMAARDLLVTTGLGMFGYRAGVGAATQIAKIRLARQLEPVGTVKGQLSPQGVTARDALAAGGGNWTTETGRIVQTYIKLMSKSADPELSAAAQDAQSAVPRLPMRDIPISSEQNTALQNLLSQDQDTARPGLDTVRQQMGGWRGAIRGIRSSDQNTFALAGEILNANPDDADAFRILDGAPDSLVAPKSGLGRVLEPLRQLSFAINHDAGGLREMLDFTSDPNGSLAATSFGSSSQAATAFSNTATITFTPVHVANDGGALISRGVANQAERDATDYTVQSEGEKPRAFYPGNERRSPFVQFVQGLGDRANVVYPSQSPDGSRVPKPSPIVRLQEFVMKGATIGSVPFLAGDVPHAIQAFNTGHPVAGLIQMGYALGDAMFLNGYRNAYVEVFRANRGMGPLVRQSRIVPWLNAPLKGAEPNPSDVTKPRLVNKGLVKNVSPLLVVGAGMSLRVVLGLLTPWDPKNGLSQNLQTALTGPGTGQPFGGTQPASLPSPLQPPPFQPLPLVAPPKPYGVKPGEWLQLIADEAGVSLAALELANPQIMDPDFILPGEYVVVPPSSLQL